MRPFSDKGRRVAVIASLAVCAVLAFSFASHGEDRCNDACLKTQLEKAMAAEPGGDMAKVHDEAVAAYLRKLHAGVIGEAAANKLAADMAHAHAGLTTQKVALADTRLAHDIAAYITDPPAKVVAPAPQRLAQATPASTAPPLDDDRTYVGEKTCLSCHQQEATNWAHTIHAKVFELNPRTAAEGRGCEACHGPGSAHVKEPYDIANIISFTHNSATPIPQQNAQCLSCHQGGPRIFWHASIHETNNLACSDCHNPMAKFSSHGLTSRESVNETCFQCHKQQRAEFSRRSHMPLLEGKLSCVDCHNPHGSSTAPLLKADSVNEVCYGCHAEKRGPFIFEHAPVRENCLNCHTPHGSNFEALLTTPRPVLCQQCHAQNGHPAELMTQGNLARGPMPDPRLIASSCQTCHSEIHGSNSPAGARFER